MNYSLPQHKPLKLAYFGSPSFSAFFLRLLLENAKELGVTIEIVFTQPDRPAGRGLQLRQTPVKIACQSSSISALYDNTIKDNISTIRKMLANHAIDLAILFAFNEMIPIELLNTPRHGFWNIHPSLLPKYRGPSPVAYPLLLGDKMTGVTLMQMDTTMDTGAIIGQVEYPIEASDTQQTILDKVPNLALRLVRKHLPMLGTEKYSNQDEDRSTITRKLKREDGFISLSVLRQLIHKETLDVGVIPIVVDYYHKNPSYTPPLYIDMQYLYQLWRGLHPWPGIWTLLDIDHQVKRIKITEMKEKEGKPMITQVQMEGGSTVSLDDFNLRYKGFL